MSIQDNAGTALLATSGGTAAFSWLAQLDTIVSILVGMLGAVGIVYSIIWHRVRIAESRRKDNESSDR